MRKKILVVNPNTSIKMTETIAQSVQAASSSFGALLDCTTVCCDKGVASVEGAFDDAVSTYWTLEKVLPLIPKFDGVLISCFSNHSSVNALRETTMKPVIHIMEAAILQAIPLGGKYSIITGSEQWRSILNKDICCLGLQNKCASVRAADMSSLETVSLDRHEVLNRILETSRVAIQDDKAEVIILGCAGLAGLQETISAALNVPVIDPVKSGICVLANLLASECTTSKRSTYTQLKARPDEVNIGEPGIFSAYGGRID